MKYVGERLEELAISNGNFSHSNLLGRSAFNRYYYAAFLSTREMLGTLQHSWRGTPHAEIPNLLRQALRKPAEREIQKMIKAGMLDLGDRSRILTSIKTNGSALAQLLTEAYDARLIADYQPEEKIVMEDKVIKLGHHKLSSARNWPDQANRYCALILRTWKELGLVGYK
ncbi:hypothetical protein GNT65_16760 [Shewanella sp. JBTF-M18]|uniref:HEPN domain-containing protein n=1 Tax=Shewanella insulae TaxID=2681496 RepID=A0A6L7I4L9_9GAMM|nr:hypothetical protein [Shewanella insulae]MXR70311.1 hypothetical protein [Shewanella insulae]